MYSSLLLALLPTTFAAPLLRPRDATLIANKFIVKFKGEVHTTAFDEVKASLASKPDFEYSFGGFNGFAGTLSDAELAQLQASDAVEYIQQDAEVHSQELVYQEDATWGLGRISHTEPGNTTYVYDSSAGEGTCAYVIDTGILTTHTEFEGRAEWLENFTGDGIDEDGYGHGTHVAGTIGGVTYGVAKKTKLYAVKVLDSGGSGTYAGVIAGIQYVATDSQTRDCPKGSVANMSLGGGRDAAVNAAVAAAVSAGVFFAIAAGNSASDATNFSPASEPSACTVGASDISDVMAYFSNYGSLVDVYAPGVDVTSSWNDGGINTISGTSMATPHVAGLGAYLLALESISTSTLCERIVELATKDVITDLPAGTANLLAYNGVDA